MNLKNLCTKTILLTMLGCGEESTIERGGIIDNNPQISNSKDGGDRENFGRTKEIEEIDGGVGNNDAGVREPNIAPLPPTEPICGEGVDNPYLRTLITNAVGRVTFDNTRIRVTTEEHPNGNYDISGAQVAYRQAQDSPFRIISVKGPAGYLPSMQLFSKASGIQEDITIKLCPVTEPFCKIMEIEPDLSEAFYSFIKTYQLGTGQQRLTGTLQYEDVIREGSNDPLTLFVFGEKAHIFSTLSPYIRVNDILMAADESNIGSTIDRYETFCEENPFFGKYMILIATNKPKIDQVRIAAMPESEETGQIQIIARIHDEGNYCTGNAASVYEKLLPQLFHPDKNLCTEVANYCDDQTDQFHDIIYSIRIEQDAPRQPMRILYEGPVLYDWLERTPTLSYPYQYAEQDCLGLGGLPTLEERVKITIPHLERNRIYRITISAEDEALTLISWPAADCTNCRGEVRME